MNTGSYGVNSFLKAAQIFDGYVGMPMATKLEKIYMTHGEFGTSPPPKVTQLASAGCQFLISIEPTKQMTKFEQHRMATWLVMLTNAGITYRIVLFAECNNKAFKTTEEWLPYWNFYAPVIKDAGVVCGFDPGCSIKAISRAEAFFPTNPPPDELWMDYYATAFRSGSRINGLIAIAKAAGVPAGMGEWGWAAGDSTFTPMTMPWWNDYCSYLIYLAGQGDLSLGANYFGSAVKGHKIDVIASTSDPRIPMIQQVAQAVQAAS